MVLVANNDDGIMYLTFLKKSLLTSLLLAFKLKTLQVDRIPEGT